MKVKSNCRICVNCGFEFEVENNQIISFSPDKSHPYSKGYSCPKGIAGIQFQQGDKNRIQSSLKRNASGEFQEIDSTQANYEIGTKLSSIVEEYGPRSVALYFGTGAYQNTLGNIMSKAWLSGVGPPNFFSSMTIDQSSHWLTAARMGVFLGGRPEVSEVDVALLSGTNPVVSHKGYPALPSNALAPNQSFRAAKRRGQKLIVVDPRRTETARFADIHLQIKPGQDAVLYAGLIHLLFRNGYTDKEFCRRFVANDRRLEQATEPFTPEYVAEVTGIDSSLIEGAAKMFGSASKPNAACGTGTAMGPNSNLADFLLESMNALRGAYRRFGDKVSNHLPLLGTQPVDAVAPPNRTWERGEKCRSQDIGKIFGEFPTALLPDEILLRGNNKIRALIVFGGNPPVAFPDPIKTNTALADLDLLVTLDHRWTETTELSHYVVATSTQYERHDLTSWGEFFAERSYLQYFPPIIEKPNQVQHDWEFFWEISKYMGIELDFKYVVMGDDYPALESGKLVSLENKPDPEELLDWICSRKGLSLEQIENSKSTMWNPEGELFVKAQPEGQNEKLDVCPDDIFFDLTKLAQTSLEQANEEIGTYRLAVRRLTAVLNSHYWQSNYAKRRYPTNFAFMNSEDMAKEGLSDGGRVEISSSFGRIVTKVRRDDQVKEGVISIPHCFNDKSNEESGNNLDSSLVSQLIPLDQQSCEAINFMPHMTGFSVHVQLV